MLSIYRYVGKNLLAIGYDFCSIPGLSSAMLAQKLVTLNASLISRGKPSVEQSLVILLHNTLVYIFQSMNWRHSIQNRTDVVRTVERRSKCWKTKLQELLSFWPNASSKHLTIGDSIFCVIVEVLWTYHTIAVREAQTATFQCLFNAVEYLLDFMGLKYKPF